MSFILEALRKSEAERAGHAAAGPPSALGIGAPTDGARRTRITWPWALSLSIAALATALGWWALNPPNGANQPISPPDETAAIDAATTPAAHNPPAAALPKPATTATPESQTPSAITPLLTQALPSPTPPNSGEDAAKNATATAKPDAAATAISPSDVPQRRQLPSAVRATLPALRLNVHRYRADPRQRFVLINMQRAGAGDTLANGLEVLDIVEHGVIVRWRGQPFLLRPGD